MRYSDPAFRIQRRRTRSTDFDAGVVIVVLDVVRIGLTPTVNSGDCCPPSACRPHGFRDSGFRGGGWYRGSRFSIGDDHLISRLIGFVFRPLLKRWLLETGMPAGIPHKGTPVVGEVPEATALVADSSVRTEG